MSDPPRRSAPNRLDGVAHIDDGGQHLVFDLDKSQRLLGDVRAGGGDGGHRVTFVEHLVRRQRILGGDERAGTEFLRRRA